MLDPPCIVIAPFCAAIRIKQGTTYYLRSGSIIVGPPQPPPRSAAVMAAMAFYGPRSDRLRLHADLCARPPHLAVLVAHGALVKARDGSLGLKAASMSQTLHELGQAALCRAAAGWLAAELQGQVTLLGDEQKMHELGAFLRHAAA